MINRSEISKRHYQKHLQRERRRRYSYFLKHKGDWFKARLIREYGLSLKDYRLLFEGQKGVCKICKKQRLDGKNLCVDHDHKTGKVRGLLCRKCNTGLGLFNDDQTLLRRAYQYIRGA